MTDKHCLNVILNDKKYLPKLNINRIKRLERYIYSYAVAREGWQMAENIVENICNAKNVNFHDPKFPFIDLIVKTSKDFAENKELLNVKSSRQNTIRSAMHSSLRGENPSQKFLTSQINYILRSTNTVRAGDIARGSYIVKKALKYRKNRNFEKTLKEEILKEYNKAHSTSLKKFNNIPSLLEKVSLCFLFNPRSYQNDTDLTTYCSIDIHKTSAKTFSNVFKRTLKHWRSNNYSIADLVFYAFSQKKNFDYVFKLSTILTHDDVAQIQNIYGLNGKMSNIKNDLINNIRDLGNMKHLKRLNNLTLNITKEKSGD
jgi:ribosomal protein S7